MYKTQSLMEVVLKEKDLAQKEKGLLKKEKVVKGQDLMMETKEKTMIVKTEALLDHDLGPNIKRIKRILGTAEKKIHQK